jgi:hypothetical protein
MLPRDMAHLCRQWLTGMFEDNAEFLGVLHKFEDIDDHLMRSSIRHYSLDLSHLVKPELPQVIIGRAAGFAPKLEISF